MQTSSHIIGWTAGMALAACLLGTTGCQRQSVATYEIPKEDYKPKVAEVPADGGMASHASGGVAKPHWVTPAGWTEKPAESMRVGSFVIPGENGKSAEVRITPLPATAEMEAGTVSMWRNELGLPEAETKPEVVEAAGAQARLYDFSRDVANDRTTNIVAAILPREGMMWFVRMSGDKAIVARERPTFLNFLKTMTFEGAPQVAAAPAAGGGAPVASKNGWKAPAGWNETAAGPMLKAKYLAGGAEITVSTAGGDLPSNVNRWRGQFGLPQASEAEIEKDVKTLTLADGSKAFAVDITGTNPKNKRPGRLYGLIVPRADGTWFYKMTGEASAVGAETNRLAEFAATAH